MADLFRKQADKYAETRPTYPPELFQFIASKTPNHDLAWDVGTGNGQAAVPLADIFKKVVATDTSQEQLSYATKLPNIHYHRFPSTISTKDIERCLAQRGTVDLVTVAQAIHWFDFPDFYDRVSFALRPPHGVLAAWCYTTPRVDERVDSVFSRLYKESDPFWAKQRELVDLEYRTIEFPFDPVDGMKDTGPVEFVIEKEMDLEMYLTYLRSWSAYQTAKERGVELLTERVVGDFESAWGGDGKAVKTLRFPVFLRIGKVRAAE